ncbi:MAG: DUF362 domain-containing protein [Spirochaetes bacterium]|nr:DUF362 domain-containing protein [Spirochaetota bacterium]
MKQAVYFSPFNNKNYVSPLDKITKILQNFQLSDKITKDELIAVKVHFGELGNTAFISPIYLRPVLSMLKELKCKPFVTDTNTLYIGMRSNSVDHLHNAMLHGFGYSTLGVPVIIADGLRGENTLDLPVDFPMVKKARLAAGIMHADGMVVISHFKGHEISGFGGAIKNISMGCASRGGKMDMHSHARPTVKAEQCTACRRCISACQVKAITMAGKAVIGEECVGCVRCIAVCPEDAIEINFNESSDNTQMKMVEYAAALMNEFDDNKLLFINILKDISPACDCYPGNDIPIADNIGFLASQDPVALDKASFDLVNEKCGYDPFKKVYPDINTQLQIDHGVKIGLGSSEYQLIEIV